MSFRNYAPAGVAFCLLLAGCGGSSSTPSTTPDGDTGSGDSVLTGVFVDSAVEGVAFATETQSGTTNAAGEFSYLAGEQVTFSIGAAQLPAVAAAAQITPVDIAASSATPAAMTTNIARLLQSLDQDGNPDNGITISADAAISASQLNFDVSTTEFENNAEVINLVANSGSVTTALISADAANAHLNSTLGTIPSSEINNDGLWLRNPASATESGLADYSFVDGLNITRYNSAISGDGSQCYTISTNTAVSLGDNRYRLEGDNSPIFYSLVRVGETLEVTFDGESTLISPRAVGIDPATLPLCSTASAFAVDDLISGSPWYAIRVYDDWQECGNSYSFAADGSLSAGSNGGTITGTYTLSDAGSLGLDTVQFGIETRQLNTLNQLEWSSNSVNNSGGEYLERAFSSRNAALEFANGLGTNCESELPL